MRPLVASGEKPKAFFPLTEIMPFKFEYNLNIENILVQNLTALKEIDTFIAQGCIKLIKKYRHSSKE